MRKLIRHISARFGRAARREDGASTIEFVILFPFFVLLVCSSLELGLLMVRHAMLERSMDISVRGLRLGTWQPPTHNELKEHICKNAAILPDCRNSLLIELRPVSTTTWQPLADGATCIDRSEEIQPVTEFRGGSSNEMMLIRACAKFDPFFPGTGLGKAIRKDDAGQYALIATTAFVNEPN